MIDLIRREDAINALVEKGQSSKRYKLGEFWELNLSEITDAIEAIPSAEPERTAKVSENATRLYCGECGERLDDYDDICGEPPIKYCPMCGAKLEWE